MIPNPDASPRAALGLGLCGLLLLVQALGGVVAAAEGGPTILWDPTSLRLIEPGATYARMTRAADGRVLCVYDRGGRLSLRASRDDGKTWDAPLLVAEDPHDALTNAEILPTRSGSLLYFWNARPRAALGESKRADPADSRTERRPFSIRMARSDDHGRTWSAPRTLYAAGTRFQDGCWEPAPIELPSGEIHVYFADEARFTRSNEQEISVLRSRDGGATWGRAEPFAFRPGHRDGMPSPTLLADGRAAVAIEDDGLSGGRFKPSILLSEPDEAGLKVIGGDDPRRRGALAEPLDPSWYAGAPYLGRFPNGTTLLSFQEDRSGAMRDCRMVVCVGDSGARDFAGASRPFPDAPGSNQLWNALFIKDDRSVIAVTTAEFRGVRGVWAVDGRLMGVEEARSGAK